MQNMELAFNQWIATQLGAQDYFIEALQGDASFRTYFRVKQADRSYIAMLAPPTKERTEAFVAIANLWKKYELQVPEILGWESQQGFVLLSDFGDALLLNLLTPESMENFYHQAMDIIALIQTVSEEEYNLPLFNEAYVRWELDLFHEWFLKKLLAQNISLSQTHLLEQVSTDLIHNFISQPQVVVHRDYHSRNLMVLNDGTLGIIDFQDAMKGPITYDLASLLKDCYIAWPTSEIHRLANHFFEKHVKDKNFGNDFAQFLQWFDWVGLQRHLKVLGIFSRLKLRDNKPHYLQHMPRIMQYVLAVTSKYDAFVDFNHYLQKEVLPVMQEVMRQQNIELAWQVA